MTFLECLAGRLIRRRSKFKGPLKDDWTCPSAHYEMACLAWYEKDLDGADHQAKVLDCEQWLSETQKFETYVLDARMGLKVSLCPTYFLFFGWR